MPIRCHPALPAFPALVILHLAIAGAADWPQFGGPNRDGRAAPEGAGPLVSPWPDDGPGVSWVAKGLGSGFSSVSVSDGRVFTMGTDGPSESVIALDASDGRALWRHPLGGVFEKNSGDGPRGTPTVDPGSGTVLAMGGDGLLVCLDATSGTPRWSRQVFDEYDALPPRHGVRESVLVEGGLAVVTPGGAAATMVALDAATGDEAWRCQVPGRPRASYASPVAATLAGIRQIVALTDSGIIGVRAADGTLLWSDTTSSGNENCATPLVLEGDRVFYSTTGGSVLLHLRREAPGAEDAADIALSATVVYRTTALANHWGGVVTDGEHLWGMDGAELVCLRIGDGATRWRSRVKGGGNRTLNRHASIVLADGHLYLRGYRGRLALVEADPDTFVPRGGFLPPSADRREAPPGYAPVAIAEGRMFLRDDDQLSAYEIRPR